MFRSDSFSSLLYRVLPDLAGLRVLDVGCGRGEKSQIMATKGADVYGIDPDTNAIREAVDKARIPEDKALNTGLQQLPKELWGMFDVATVWLFCIPYNDREACFDMLAACIKPQGKVVISVGDDQFVHGSSSVIPSLQQHFGSVVITNGMNWDSYIITCQQPRPELNLIAAEQAAEPQQTGKFLS